MQNKWMNRVSVSVAVLGFLAACEKHDAAATQAMGAISNVASQAGQKFDEAADYVAPHVDSVKNTAEQNLQSGTTMPDISASQVAATARRRRTRGRRPQAAAMVGEHAVHGAGGQSRFGQRERSLRPLRPGQIKTARILVPVVPVPVAPGVKIAFL
jgi:hypothetical protein